MAKIKYGQGVQEMRGSVEGSTFARNRYGTYVRGKGIPVQPSTAAQKEQREMMRIVSNAWRLLDESAREAWNNWKLEFSDVFGDVQTLSGQALFVKVNLVKLSAGEPMIEDAPEDRERADMPSAINFNRGTLDAMTISTLPDPLEGDIRLFVRMTAPMSVGIKFDKGLFRLVAVSDLNQAGTLDVKQSYVDVFGDAPETAEHWNVVKVGVLVEIYKSSNGLLSPGVKAVITGTEATIPIFSA